MQSPQDLAAALTAHDKDDEAPEPKRRVKYIGKAFYGPTEWGTRYIAFGDIGIVLSETADEYELQFAQMDGKGVFIKRIDTAPFEPTPAAADPHIARIAELEAENAKLKAALERITPPTMTTFDADEINSSTNKETLVRIINERAARYEYAWQLQTPKATYIVWRLITSAEPVTQHDSEQTVFTEAERNLHAAADAYRDETEAALDRVFNIGISKIRPRVIRPILEKPQ